MDGGERRDGRFDTRTFTNTGNDRCVWQQDNTTRTARITNLYLGKTYTVTVTAQGAMASGSHPRGSGRHAGPVHCPAEVSFS